MLALYGLNLALRVVQSNSFVYLSDLGNPKQMHILKIAMELVNISTGHVSFLM